MTTTLFHQHKTIEKLNLKTCIKNRLDTEDWDNSDLDLFIYELAEIGIKTAADFNKRFRYESNHPSPYEDYVWFYYIEIKEMDEQLLALSRLGLIFDWKSIWYAYLEHKTDCFYFYKSLYFFSMPFG